MTKPLSGIRVLEFSTFVAAPVAARLMADLGAEVIKVERPEGDPWRRTGISYVPSQFSDQENPVFDIYNSGKKHIALNLKSEEGMAAFHKLLAATDVMITNTRPKALRKLGLDYESLKERYPKLVYAILLGYGENGPDKDMPAFDTSAFWARGGFLRDMALAGDNYAPVQPPSSMGDTVSGYLLLAEVCAALFRRSQTGLGDCVRSGLYHNSIFTLGTMNIVAQKPDYKQLPRERTGFSVPAGDHCCADGEWIFISGYDSRLYPKMHALIGREDLDEIEELKTPAGRWERRVEYYETFRQAFLTQPSTYWLQKAKELDIPMTRMPHFRDIHKDEQAWANDYLENVVSPSGNTNVMPRSPIEMDSVGALKTIPAPQVGADTDVVLQQLGYSPEAIAEMKSSGSVK